MRRGPERATTLTFGEQLRRLRVAAGLTQQALAERSGLSPEAIAALENGRRRRPRRTTLAMLARGLQLTPGDLRRLESLARPGGPDAGSEQAAHTRPPAPGVGLPPDPVAHFVGREVELAELRWRLRRHGRATIDGLGGVGKTQLAAWHLRLCRADYPDGVFWLRADREASLVGDLAGLSWRLELPEREERQQERQIEAVLRWLRGRTRWLLVLDNLEPAVEDAARHWLPDLPGHLLLTSRTPVGTAPLHLGPLPLEMASRFLLDRTGQTDGEAAIAVAERLGCLPLALEQAAAYLEASGRDLASYASLLGTRLLDLMSDGHPADYPRPVASTWQLSFDRVAEERPAAIALLDLCAFLAPDDVPVSVLVASADELPAVLARTLTDAVELDRTIATLRRYSLVERRGDGLRIHRLVQAVVRESLPAGRRDVWLGAAIRLLRARYPAQSDRHPEHWALCSRLLPHVQAAAAHAGDREVERLALAWLIDQSGTYLHARGELSAARPLKERALAMRERALGPEHLEVAGSLNNLATLVLEQGEVAAANALSERALAIRERVLGADHADFVESLNNLGMARRDLGDLAGARPFLERALAIRERVLAPDDPQVALSLNNLALLLGELGELEPARPLQERALAINERRLGPDHPHTAITLGNLGNLLRDQGDLAAAEALLERALGISRRVLGAHHPQTANGLDNLALLRWRQGDLDAARSLLERGLAIRERQLGGGHPRTARSLERLGRLLAEQGERDRAIALVEGAVVTYERALGPGHPTTARTRSLLGDLTRVAVARPARERPGHRGG